MPELIVPIEAVLLMFVLGLRHGLDPDHIAMVDSMSYRRHGQASRSWTAGAMFAAGHGAAVTVAAMVLHAVGRETSLAEPWATLFGWLPVALLLAAASINLRSLLRPASTPHPGAAPKLLFGLCPSSHPLIAFGVGVMFAVVFDTATQLAAWSHAGAGMQGYTAALLVGLAFTAGMVIIDALDSTMLQRLLADPDPSGRERYRRRTGWLTVAIAYGVAAHGAVVNLWPEMAVEETTLTALGAGMVGAFIVLGLWNRWQASRGASFR